MVSSLKVPITGQGPNREIDIPIRSINLGAMGLIQVRDLTKRNQRGQLPIRSRAVGGQGDTSGKSSREGREVALKVLFRSSKRLRKGI